MTDDHQQAHALPGAGDTADTRAAGRRPRGGFWRTGSAATLLGNGDVLVTGGYACLATTYPCTIAAAMLYDPATSTWTGTGAMTASRAFQTSTLLPGGQVLVAGGESVTKGKITYLASAELCTP